MDMYSKVNDLGNAFIAQYEKGDFLAALQLILSHPDVTYDHLVSQDPAFWYLVNYADACAFSDSFTMYVASQALQTQLSTSSKAQKFLERLQWESYFLHPILLNEDAEKLFSQLNEVDIEVLPLPYQTMLKAKLELWKRIRALKATKPQWTTQVEARLPMHAWLPWHFFAYQLPVETLPALKPHQTPLIFLEPVEGLDYEAHLAPFLQAPAIFACETMSSFLQLLQFPGMESILARHCIYILELYPCEQFACQMAEKWGTLCPVILLKRKMFSEYIPLLIQALTAYLTQPDLKQETPAANWLYQLSCRMLYSAKVERYGPSRFIALHVEESYRTWFDPHKGLIPPQVHLGPNPKDYLQEYLAALPRKANPFTPQNKIRLAHIVPQMVGLQHAPTRLVTTLLQHADQVWFDLFLISTERMLIRPLDYPVCHYRSEPSPVLANFILNYLDSLGIHIHCEAEFSTYASTAEHIARLLKELQIDVAVFHGPDDINCLCSALCEVPVRILFEHGTLPAYPVFDLAILSTPEAVEKHQVEYKQMGMETCYLNYSVDVKATWKNEPYSKVELGFPENSFIMTTISNHLDARLGSEMLHAIGAILKRCPQAYYAPIGNVKKSDRMRAIWQLYGVNDRVIFLGQKPDPSQYARSMELYLNEIPFGSGLGMLDAMASGCPVVSMYDPEGVPQARYAATYFGVEYVIKTGRVEDYVELACRLIEEPLLYQQWSEHALNQYEKRVDTQQYVKNFEKLMEIFINYKTGK
jgi:glycosyltransferase involved in cell wall biosynthesis